MLVLMLCASFVKAQDAVEKLTSKRGVAILPEAGEWGLGISADPFLRYFGNFINGNTGNNAPSFTYSSNPTNNVAVFGKKIVDENTAYRVRFNIGAGQDIFKQVIAQNELTPDANFPAFTEDWQKTNYLTVVLAPGFEKRRGSTRLQGIYGAELVIAYSSTTHSYEYGNPITSDFNAPITYNFGSNILSGNSLAASSRVLENKYGGSIFAGARGFVGVEYFFAPKISIGGEFGYTLGFRTQGRSLITSESWNSSAGSVLETKTDYYRNSGYTSISAGLDNINGSINLLFYF